MASHIITQGDSGLFVKRGLIILKADIMIYFTSLHMCNLNGIWLVISAKQFRKRNRTNLLVQNDLIDLSYHARLWMMTRGVKK